VGWLISVQRLVKDPSPVFEQGLLNRSESPMEGLIKVQKAFGQISLGIELSGRVINAKTS
jgi:hypothetical protein